MNGYKLTNRIRSNRNRNKKRENDRRKKDETACLEEMQDSFGDYICLA